MKLPILKDFFPINNAMAELYGGTLAGHFFTIVFNQENVIEQIRRANIFLKENGFETEIHESDFDDNKEIELELITFSYKALGPNMLMMTYEQPILSQPINSLIELITLFRDERDWKQFHTPKNLTMAISSEVGELLDLFLWDRSKDVKLDKVANEISDILIYLLLLSKELNIDVFKSVIEKIKLNYEKYPSEKSKGSDKKYNEL